MGDEQGSAVEKSSDALLSLQKNLEQSISSNSQHLETGLGSEPLDILSHRAPHGQALADSVPHRRPGHLISEHVFEEMSQQSARDDAAELQMGTLPDQGLESSQDSDVATSQVRLMATDLHGDSEDDDLATQTTPGFEETPLMANTQPVARVDPGLARQLFIQRQSARPALPEFDPTPEESPADPPSALVGTEINTPTFNFARLVEQTQPSPNTNSSGDIADGEDPVQVFGTPRDPRASSTANGHHDLHGVASDGEYDRDIGSVVRTTIRRRRRLVGVIEETPIRDRVPDTQDNTQVAIVGSQLDATLETPARSKFVADESLLAPSPEHAKSPQTEPAKLILNDCKLVKWQNSWYPAFLENGSEALSNPKAQHVVVFGTGDTDAVRSTQVGPCEFMVGDKVNHNGRNMFEIVRLVRTAGFTRFRTDSGYDSFVIEEVSRKGEHGSSFTVKLEEIWLTDKAYKLWKAASEKRTSVLATLKRPLPQPSFIAPAKRLRDLDRSMIMSNGHSSQIFENCVFTLTIEGHEEARDLGATIRRAGGEVLENGISDMLSIDYENMTLDWKQGPAAHFGAVLATRPLKTPKYLEGMAFGWPCLSFQFVEDCLKSGEFLNNWPDYALPAGDSALLDTAVSYDVSDFMSRWSAGHDLRYQFQRRRLSLGAVSAPIYLLEDASTAESYRPLLLLLMAVTSRAPLRASRLADVPSGSLVLNGDKSSTDLAETSPLLRLRLCRQLVFDQTVVLARDWLIQCIINQRLV